MKIKQVGSEPAWTMWLEDFGGAAEAQDVAFDFDAESPPNLILRALSPLCFVWT